MNRTLRVSEMDPLTTDLVVGERSARLSLRGEFDLAGVPAAEAALSAALSLARPVEIDISGICFLDSSGLALLLRAATGPEADRLRFVGPAAPAVARMLAITGVDLGLRDAAYSSAAARPCSSSMS